MAAQDDVKYFEEYGTTTKAVKFNDFEKIRFSTVKGTLDQSVSNHGCII